VRSAFTDPPTGLQEAHRPSQGSALGAWQCCERHQDMAVRHNEERGACGSLRSAQQSNSGMVRTTPGTRWRLCRAGSAVRHWGPGRHSRRTCAPAAGAVSHRVPHPQQHQNSSHLPAMHIRQAAGGANAAVCFSSLHKQTQLRTYSQVGAGARLGGAGLAGRHAAEGRARLVPWRGSNTSR
jgi:hypothetical protein